MDDFRALHIGICHLAALDPDNASVQNGVGFSKPHSYFGKRMANIRFEEWDDAMIYTAWDTLRHYKEQLAACGINWDDIPVPPAPNKEAFLERAKHTAKMLSIPRVLKIDPDNGDLIVSWGKNETTVTEFKEKFVYGTEIRWDKDRFKGWWIYPQNIGTIDKVFEFAERWGITITDEALLRLQVVRSHFEKGTLQQREIVAPIKTGRYVIPHESNPLEFRVYFDYDRKVYYAISSSRDKVTGDVVDDRYKAFVRRYEDNKTLGKNWIITCIDEKAIDLLKRFTDEYGFEYRDGAAERLEQIRNDSEKNKAASSAMDTDFRVRDGLLRDPRPFQHAGVQFGILNGNHLNADEMGTGKAQPLDAKILTPRGWTTMGKLKVGDRVVGSDGCETFVEAIYPQGVKDIYRITFKDGSYTECCEEHLWAVNTTTRRFRNNPHIIKQLKDLQNDLFFDNGNAKYFIPMVSPVKFDLTYIPLDPYFLGLLIGDGSLTLNTPAITSADDEILDAIRDCLPDGIRLIRSGTYGYNISGERPKANPITESLRLLGLMGKSAYDKFIPDSYKYNTVSIRVSLLQGLMDTDGSISKNHMEYSTSSEQLAKDVQEIVESLGGKAVMTTRIPSFKYKNEKRFGAQSWRLHISLPNDIQPFRLKRKIANWEPKTKYIPARPIVSIEHVGQKEAQCIRVSASDHLYVTDRFVVTHNTFQSIALTYHLECYPALVICPASLKYNWRNEIQMTIPNASVSVYEKGDPNLATDWLIINYDMVTKKLEHLLSRQWGHLICDEAHKLKNPKASWSKSVLEISQKSTKRVTLLTGTPLMNKPDDMIMPLRIINKLNSHFKNITNFQNRYCNMTSKTYGKKTYRVSGEPTNLTELNQHLRNGIMIRRLKRDVLKELPPMTRSIIHLKIDNRAEYEKAERDIVSYVREFAANDKRFLESIKDLPPDEKEKARRDHANDKAYKAARAEILVQINHLRQIAAKGKLSQVKKWVEEFLESGEKLIIFGYYQSVVEEFGKAFDAPMIYGSVDAKKRQEYVEAFQNDSEARLLVLNMDSGGVGLTLTAASNSVFVELNWNPARITQAEARISRMGQMFPQTIYYFIDPTTIDSYMMDMVLAKQAIINEAIDGDENDGFAIDKEVAERNGMDYANVLLEKYGVEGVEVH